MSDRRPIAPSGAARRVPLPVLGALVLLLAAAPIGVAVSADGPSHDGPRQASLDAVAREGGCTLSEFDHDPRTNPPVSGRVDERVSAEDGSYVGRRSPSTPAATHALLHGRVVLQYRPGLPAAQRSLLDRLVRHDPRKVLLFANRTGMRHPVAATAYLSLLTCPRVDAGALRALRVFRDRRRDFGQGF